jgi:hypothetical protein
MYNPATQVQVPTDAELGSYYLKKHWRGFPYRVFLSKKKMDMEIHIKPHIFDDDLIE